jgi:hypothetical protein
MSASWQCLIACVLLHAAGRRCAAEGGKKGKKEGRKEKLKCRVGEDVVGEGRGGEKRGGEG